MQQRRSTEEQDPDSNDPNPSFDSDVDEETENGVLGVQDVTIPWSHSDDSVTIRVCPGEEDAL